MTPLLLWMMAAISLSDAPRGETPMGEACGLPAQVAARAPDTPRAESSLNEVVRGNNQFATGI